VSLAESLVGLSLAGKYRIRRVVGAGSMGFVCEAEHLEIGKRVAIKLIDKQLKHIEEMMNRFRREARAASLVESDHIVQVYDVDHDPQHGLYMVMEYLTGEDLATRIAREGPLDPHEAALIAAQVARGLSRAHASGVVHRDLKPANIFLVTREDGALHVKILDFGISKLLEPEADASGSLKLTRSGTAIGTPQYMSPEQAQGLSVDNRTDVWSLGLVLYEMLAGEPAYPELPTYEQFIINLVNHPPRPLRSVARHVPLALEAVVRDAIQHDLARRIRDCATFAHRIGTAMAIGSRSRRAHDTFDEDRVSPLAHALPPGEDAEEDWPQPSRTFVMREPPVMSEGAPPSAKPVPIAPSPPRAPYEGRTVAAIGSSGVRSAPDEGVVADEEDAPQFFDRRVLLQALAANPSASGRKAVTASAAPAPPSAPDARRAGGSPVAPISYSAPDHGSDRMRLTMPDMRSATRHRMRVRIVAVALLVLGVCALTLFLALRAAHQR
jgi:serine/threonine-protein kinase